MARRKSPWIPDEMLDQLLSGADASKAFDQGGLLDRLKKALAERALNAEMDHHLAGEGGAGNSRNGYGRKSVVSDTGRIGLEVPRDRQGSFDPVLIAKYQRRFPGFDEKIVSMYGRYPWLGVLDETHHFVFLIDGVPVRFFRGDAEEPSKRTLRQQESEAQQLALALGDAGGAEGLMFRLAVESGEGGEVTRVVFLALRGEEGRVECFWPVPLGHDDVSPQGRKNTGAGLAPPLAAGTLRRRG